MSEGMGIAAAGNVGERPPVEAPVSPARYTLRERPRLLLSASFASSALAFAIAAYVLFPYVPGPNLERVWWHFNTFFIVLAGLSGIAALLDVRQDQLRAPADIGGRLHTWRLLAFTTTVGSLGGFVLLALALGPGAPLWYSYSANVTAAILAVLALATCYLAPVGHWWELMYSMGLLLNITGAFAYWFPAIDGVFGSALFLAIMVKWAQGVYRRGMPKIDFGGNPLGWILGFGRPLKQRAARQHEYLYTLMLGLGVAPLVGLIAFRPYFDPWNEEALDQFGYIMLLGTTIIYTTPLLTAGGLLFWCRKYQCLTLEERNNHFTRRENLALVLLGLASYVMAAGYYLGYIMDRDFISSPLAKASMGIAGSGMVLALFSRRRLLLFAVLLPIAVAVTLRKLNYVGDFLMPLYVGDPLSF